MAQRIYYLFTDIELTGITRGPIGTGCSTRKMTVWKYLVGGSNISPLASRLFKAGKGQGEGKEMELNGGGWAEGRIEPRRGWSQRPTLLPNPMSPLKSGSLTWASLVLRSLKSGHRSEDLHYQPQGSTQGKRTFIPLSQGQSGGFPSPTGCSSGHVATTASCISSGV